MQNIIKVIIHCDSYTAHEHTKGLLLVAVRSFSACACVASTRYKRIGSHNNNTPRLRNAIWWICRFVATSFQLLVKGNDVVARSGSACCCVDPGLGALRTCRVVVPGKNVAMPPMQSLLDLEFVLWSRCAAGAP